MNKFIIIFIVFIFWAINLKAAETFNNFNLTNQAIDLVNNPKVKNPFEGEGNVYEQIFDSLNHEYEHLGKLAAQKAIDNKVLVTGGLNSAGLSYHRPYGDFSIAVNRVVAPDPTSDKWVVTDSLTIHIDASKIINKLKNQNAININEQNMALFAGVVFERKFYWYHFAKSYEEGLSTHFEKLFFPFKGVELKSIQTLGKNEFITKEDSISVNAGGFVSAPIYTGVSGMGGILTRFERLSKMELIRNDDDVTKKDFVHINFEKTNTKDLHVNLSVMADVLSILKMTLLSYDLEYKYDSSYKIFCLFPMDFISTLKESDPVTNEIQNIIKTKMPAIDVLAPYVVSEERKLSELIAHKYNFLIFGGGKQAKTSEIEITKNGVVKTFFQHNFEKIKYTENGLSRLLMSFLYKIFNSEMKAKNNASELKKLTIEYNSEKNLLEEHEDFALSHETQNLSMSFSGNYTTNKSKGPFAKKYKEKAKFMIERYSGIDNSAISLIDQGVLVAPFEIIGMYQIHLDGIRYFNQLSVQDVFDNIDGVCTEKPKSIFFKFRSLFDHCKNRLKNDFYNYRLNLSHQKVTGELISSCENEAKEKHLHFRKKRIFVKMCIAESTYLDQAEWTNIPLWELKTFSQNLVNNVESKVYYYNLFGINNVFFYGQFSAKQLDGSDFVTYFHEGQFKGLGVVDDYMRKENMRTPANIVVNQ